MSSYEELLKQREELDQKIKQARSIELKDAILQVREVIGKFELTEVDVFGKARGTHDNRAKVAPKYRNPATGETWTGRGKATKWIADQEREKFLIV